MIRLIRWETELLACICEFKMNDEDRQRLMHRATYAVKQARKRGVLPDLDGTIICYYCEIEPASMYDHRDYNFPLDVRPACRSCNRTLPAATPTPDRVLNRKRVYTSEVSSSAPDHIDQDFFPGRCVLPQNIILSLPERMSRERMYGIDPDIIIANQVLWGIKA